MFDIPGPRAYSIPSAAPFVDCLAETLTGLAAGDSFKLAEMRVLLPTRRACRSLAEAFLRESGGAAALLPRLTPLGDIDEDELSITEFGGLGDAGDAHELPPAIPGLRRQLLLARAVMAMPGHALQPEQASALALELARLLDRLATERADPARLKTLVPTDFAEHWQDVLRFLDILVDRWPTILMDEGALDPAARRNALLESQAALWRDNPPTTPIIAAGSTGSIPATAELLGVVAKLPRGAVILPGLDRTMDDTAWTALGPTHPQFGLKQLLDRLGLDRDAVAELGAEQTPGRRERLFTQALRPAKAPLPDLTENNLPEDTVDGVHKIDCPGPAEEAAVIGLIMRRTLETPGKTCALITPDRGLARRVAAVLKRWRIDVDDSAGMPLSQTPPAAFLRLLATAVGDSLAPIKLLALLKHPLAGGGLATADFRALVRELEIQALRGPRPGPGIDGIRRALGKKAPGQLRRLLDIVESALAPCVQAMAQPSANFSDVLTAHLAAAEALAATDADAGASRLWAGDAGEAAAGFVAELAESLPVLGPLPPGTYPGLFEGLMSGRVVRPRFGAHPRLHVWGLLEARLQHADTVVLGGLNEGVWPPEPETNPWMSRPMMAAMGLEPPERRIGLTAHDFQQAFAAPEVYLTRAYRVAGAPTVPSRWLLRLENVLAQAGSDGALTRQEGGDDWLGWAAALDRTEKAEPDVPKPRPPADKRPKELSVTRIETLIRDPYAIYARYILRLKPLDPLDADPGAAERGTLVHEALDQFVATHPETLPEDAERRLLDIGREVFGERLTRPGVRAFWWPRFERIAHWFVGWQRARLDDGWSTVLTERTGKLELDAVAGGFTIAATPDRIDYRPDTGLVILDYKTGQPPSAKQVASGLTPQLPLEAAIALAGGFKDVPESDVAHLAYVHLSGGRHPGRENVLKLDVRDVTEQTLDGVKRLIVRFADPETPYISRPRPQFESRFGDYDHLARVLEWGGGTE